MKTLNILFKIPGLGLLIVAIWGIFRINMINKMNPQVVFYWCWIHAAVWFATMILFLALMP